LSASILAAGAHDSSSSPSARIQSTVKNRDARAISRTIPLPHVVNGLSFLALIVLAIGIVVAYRVGVVRGSRDGEADGARLRREIADLAAESWQMRELAEDRRRLLRAIADSRDETANYRQLLIDLENNAPPLLLDSPGAPDDTKLIVGIGAVLERMLQQLGINSYRQIARWTDRDIDEFNARLPDFPGRIRRDAWVTQARALHQSKYGEVPPSRERG